MPLLPAALAFAAGMATASWVGEAPAWRAAALATAAGAAFLLLRLSAAGALALLVAIAALGVLRATPPPLPAGHVTRLSLPARARVEGRLAGEPVRWARDRTRLLLDVERVDETPRHGRVQATLYGEPPDLAGRQRLRLTLRLHRARGFRNPGTFDHGAYLARQGVHVVGTGRAHTVEPLEPPAPTRATRARRRAVAMLQAALPPASAALLAGLLLGERTALPPELDRSFRAAGVSHILAVSGFNVALLAGAVWVALGAVGVPRRVTAAGALAAVLAFAAVVGPEPSVLRATLMAALVLGALVLDRQAAVVNSLALAALAILALRPADLHDPGFQLSFAATAGIVAAPIPRGRLAGALAVSAVAQAAVLPVTLAHFNQVSTLGLLANLVVVPLAALATILGLAGLATGLASEVAGHALLGATWPVLLLLRGAVALAASVPWAVIHLPAPGPFACALYALALGLGLAAWRTGREDGRRARRTGTAALALGVAAAALALWPALRAADGRLRVVVLDVGQGDAIVVEGPDGRVVLVDAGSGGPYRLDAGERVVAPFLWNRGHLRLAGTVTTHPDSDHAGGMAAIHRLFPVGERWDVTRPLREPLALGGVLITPLNGGAGPWGPAAGESDNDRALVLRVDYGLASFLLASDIEAAAERRLAAAGAVLAATVLKVPHHGARTSTGPLLAAAVRPSVAVVSVGARNAYGHPDPGVLARLAAAGARIFRTDRDGAVVLETDGRVLDVRRWATGATERLCLDPETIC